MSRVHHRRHAVSSLSRRRVLVLAASVGVGASAVSVAGMSLAGETPGSTDAAPLVVSLRDAKKGTLDVFTGGSKLTVTDKKLAAQILKAAHRG
jgi:hypothetical protein